MKKKHVFKTDQCKNSKNPNNSSCKIMVTSKNVHKSILSEWVVNK